MNSASKLGIGLCFAAALSYGANISGKLIDASCYDGHSTQTSSDKSHSKLEKTCAATASTATFAIMASGNKVYKLDSAGNVKAEEAMKSGALKPDDDGDVHANIAGTMQGDTVKVDSVSGGKTARSKENTR
jgi:hypothetical protein